MSTNKAISLTDEAMFTLEKIRKDDPNFNFSGFISIALVNFYKNKSGEIEKLEDVEDKLSEQKIEVEKQRVILDNLEERYRRLKVEREQREQERIARQLSAERNLEFNIKFWAESFTEIFGIPKSKANDLAIEFNEWRQQGNREDKSIGVFYKEKFGEKDDNN